MLKSSAPPETSLLTDSGLRLLAICGIVGPILFTTIVILLAAIEPGYSHLSQPISQLGRVNGPNSAIQNTNFALTGALFVAFAVGLHRGIGRGNGSIVAPSLVALGGLGFIASAVFQCPAAGCGFTTLTGTVHNVVGLASFLAFGGAALSLARRLKTDALWQGYGTFSLVTGLLDVVLLIAYIASNPILPAYRGGAQRLLVGTFLVWMVVMAVRLFQISSLQRQHLD